MAPVTYERSGPAAVMTIDRPERRNAIDGPTADLLGEGYERFEADDEARVLILAGAGGVAFSAGADLKAIESLGPRLDDPRGPLGMSRVTPSKPTIAAIAGWCLAGGLELALWCDLRIATENSQLGFPERRWGVPLIDGGTHRLPPRADARDRRRAGGLPAGHAPRGSPRGTGGTRAPAGRRSGPRGQERSRHARDRLARRRPLRGGRGPRRRRRRCLTWHSQ